MIMKVKKLIDCFFTKENSLKNYKSLVLFNQNICIDNFHHRQTSKFYITYEGTNTFYIMYEGIKVKNFKNFVEFKFIFNHFIPYKDGETEELGFYTGREFHCGGANTFTKSFSVLGISNVCFINISYHYHIGYYKCFILSLKKDLMIR